MTFLAVTPRAMTLLGRRASFLIAVCVGALAFVAWGGTAARAQSLEPLGIETTTGTRQFQVEVMRTDAERRQGLMFRKELAADRGMLFDFDGREPILMWMKNTILPLDMIFFQAGRVVSIAQNTQPYSERIISSQVPASQVIEVNAGTAARLGIAVGDRLVFTPKSR